MDVDLSDLFALAVAAEFAHGTSSSVTSAAKLLLMACGLLEIETGESVILLVIGTSLAGQIVLLLVLGLVELVGDVGLPGRLVLTDQVLVGVLGVPVKGVLCSTHFIL